MALSPGGREAGEGRDAWFLGLAPKICVDSP